MTTKKNKILLQQLKEFELENKILKEQLKKAFPVVKLENIKTWKDIFNYLIKKYGNIIWWIEFLIILNIKDIAKWILFNFPVGPSNLLNWIFKLLKGGKFNV